MRIGINLTPLLAEHTGVDNYVMQLVRSLARIDQTNAYTLFINREDAELFEGRLPPNFTVIRASVRSRLARLAFEQLGLPLAARRQRLDVVHSPSFFTPLYHGQPRHLLTVYDMTFVSLPTYHTAFRRSWLFGSALSWSIAHADLVTVPSQSTRASILALLPRVSPNRIVVVPAGVAEEFRPQPEETVRALRHRLGLQRPYILHVGTLEPRKNLTLLLQCYERLIVGGDVGVDLVLAGRPGWSYEALVERLQSPVLRGRVHLLGYVPSTDLPPLYAGAEIFVYPSFHEGFGFPPLEAMACGIPTIASDTSALAENLSGAALLVAPTDGAGLIAALRRLLDDAPLRAQLREQGFARAAQFRWDQTARQTRAYYTALADQTESRDRDRLRT